MLLLALTLGACSNGEAPSVLETGPRVPDAEGVVEDVSFERIVLDGDRTYRVHPDVESFTSRGHDPMSLLQWEGRYVHIGLTPDEEAVWIAGIGVVARSDPPRVLYTGVFAGVDEEGRGIFEDGTVLRLDDGVEPVAEGREALAELNPERRVVTRLVEQ